MIPSGQRDLGENQYCDSSNLKARAELHQRFSTNPYRYEDALVVKEAEPLVAYVFSMYQPYAPSLERRDEFAEFVGQQLATGPIRITKDVGMLVAARA